jgi:enoyl-CoA hydratase/carnithine racemase
MRPTGSDGSFAAGSDRGSLEVGLLSLPGNRSSQRLPQLSNQQVLYDARDRIATITLNRPERLNALAEIMERELRDAMQAAAEDREVRVIVLTGAGRGFCAGGDVTGFGNVVPEDVIRRGQQPFDANRRADYQTRCSWFPAIPKPIIAMVNGPTAGLGLLYALFCDVRFAAEEAVFTTAYSRRGISAEFGMAWILSKIVGHANALELLLSGRKVAGPEALRLGLVHQVYPGDQLAEATRAYAREMADFVSPRSTRGIKEQVYDVPFQTLAEAVVSANQDLLVSNRCNDFREGTASFLEKRPPRFTGD